MMYYAIIAEDRPGSLDNRLAARAAHLQRLAALRENGRLLIAGPHPAIDAADPGDEGFSGSLVVAEFASLQDAEKWAADDPYQHANVYARVTVKPFKRVF